ncbi:glycosyltransferase [Saccharospirillum mangrovi]|uniref:glycosyltransferase n=1 Tax=Saccharospirillum mangrovi TaxID=2161747 RepID=UPI000D372EFC|nr:glycosyltransferase [Saccharospirillum mangrovi]
MKVVFFLRQFPVPSETFVVNQIADFIDGGVDVEIVSIIRGGLGAGHKKYSLYGMDDYTTYLTDESLSQKKYIRLWKRLKSVCAGIFNLKTAKSLNFFKYGIDSISLLLPSITKRANNIFQSPPDVIICHFGTTATIAANLIDLGVIDSKLIAIFHGYEISVDNIIKRYKNQYRRLFRISSSICPISNYWKEKLLELGCVADKISIFRMGVDLNYYNASIKRNEDYKSLISIASVARLVPKKGLKYSIRAMSMLRSLGVAFKYDIVGEGPEKERLIEEVNRLNLNKHIHFHGHLSSDAVNNLLNETDVFLLPSVMAPNGDKEGIPVSLMEAMAKGIIVVSTFHSGIPELIENEVSGFLVEEKNERMIANVLNDIFNNKYDLGKMSKNARYVVRNSFDSKEISKSFIAHVVGLNS